MTFWEFDLYTRGESFEAVRAYIEHNVDDVDIHIISKGKGDIYSVYGVCSLSGLMDMVSLRDIEGLQYKIKEVGETVK